MAKILFRLNDVSVEEADDVRELLVSHDIDFYETSAGNWGVSLPAIWLNDADQYPKARSLLDEYQNQRTIRLREEYALLKKEGKNKTWIDAIKQNPLQILSYLAVSALVLYLSAKLVIDLGS